MSVLIVGVGGQGVILASAVIADAARRVGHDVKQSEVHGMAQRGGVVTSHVRYGSVVRSPLIAAGEADVVVACEWNEAVRALPYLRRGGTAIASLERIVPPRALAERRSGRVSYPPLFEGSAALDLRACDAVDIARQAGNAKAANAVLLGMVSMLLPFPGDAWREALAAHVPAGALAANERAFDAGRGVRTARGRPRRLAHAAEAPAAAAPAIEIVPAWCKGVECGVCVRVCPERCLAFDGSPAVSAVRPAACTGCRLCETFCPDFAITIHEAVPA